MSAQHTPGPWTVQVWDYSHASPPRKELNVQSASNLLATVQCDFSGNNPYIIAKGEAEANAALIAAAPELLGAVRRLLECAGADDLSRAGLEPEDLAAIEQAEAAVAKAEGSR